MSRDEIRRRARLFAQEWGHATSEQADRQSFWNEFYEIFGLRRRHVAVYEQAAQRVSTGNIGWIDLLQPGEMGVEHKSRGADLDAAMDQLYDYLASVPANDMPWLLVVCDFGTFRWRNIETQESGEFVLSDLPENLEQFWWLAGEDRPSQVGRPELDVNIQATELLAVLHDELAQSGYPDHDMREWLTRILFCLFADDAEVWERKLFELFIESRTADDGSDLGSQMDYMFQVLNTEPTRRSTALDDDLAAMTYVNGDLFARRLSTPSCTPAVRDALRRACRYNWSKVSPAIFGSLFQNVMTPIERRELGAHYTTEENILRTIRPLFLDDLAAELESSRSRPALQRFHDKLAGLTFFDPACGCGNFLVVSYLEVRKLETEVLRRLHRRRGETTGQRAFSLDLLCRVKVDQFYGIEIAEFPALIARTALYLADHIANREVSSEFGEHFIRFPIPASPHILQANALRVNWSDLLPASHAHFVFGNPPFSGHALYGQHPNMAEDRDLAFADLQHRDSRVGRLDYVAAWYAKAIPYMLAGNSSCAFVSTNSITQGEQARSMGPILEQNEVEISFAHRTFEWTSEARGTAHVHVVIVGIAPRNSAPHTKRLFEYPTLRGEPVERQVRKINWYLVEGPGVYPKKHEMPLISGVPGPLTKGSQPTDGGHLIVTIDQYSEIMADPIAAQYVRPFKQSKEFLYDTARWCLWLVDASPADLRRSAVLQRRLAMVQTARRNSPTPSVVHAASTPYLFTQRRQPRDSYLAIPEVSGEGRDFIPAKYLDPDVIAGNKLLTLVNAPLWVFGILQSSMWMAWVRTIVGRMKSDFSVSPDIAYNAFPWPDLTDVKRDRIAAAAKAALQARPAGVSLAELYDPTAMPEALVAAHRNLDSAVDAAYGRHRHLGDATRLAVLLRRYVELTGGDSTLFDEDA